MPWKQVIGRIVVITMAVATAGCGGDDGGPTPPSVPVPTTVTTTGSGQTGTVGAPLPASIGVTVLDQNGDAVAGVVVSFAVVAGGGRTVGVSANTNAQGLATVIWILGPAAGINNNTVTAGLLGYSGPLPTFTASAAAGAVARLVKIAGDSQSGEVLQPLSQPLSVRAQDALGNPVPNVTVGWNVIEGRGSSSPSTTMTDASGLATTTWSPGPVVGAHTQRLRAVLSGVPWVDFAASAVFTSGALGIAAGDNQAGVIGTATPVRPAVVVKTPGSAGVPVEGVGVDWEVSSGGGSISATLGTTDGDGLSSTEWTLGGSPGINNQGLRATVPGLTGSPTTFAATATLWPSQISIVSGDGQSGTVGTLLPQPLVVLVRDSTGAPVAGTEVVWDFPEGNTSGVTDATGHASLAFTLFPTAGGQLVGARVPTANDPGVIVLFHFEAAPGPAAQIEMYTGNGQTATVGTLLPEPVSVIVRDAYGNVRSGAPVDWQAITGSSTVASSITDSMGQASTGWTIGTVAGASNQALIARLVGIPGAQRTFTATAKAGLPASVTLVSGNGQGSVVGTTLASPLVVSVKDVYGNPNIGTNVTWIATIGGGWTSAPLTPTSAAGEAAVTRTLGGTVGAQTTTASVAGSPPLSVIFDATGSALVSGFTIDLRYLTPMSPARQAAFQGAATRWSNIIYGDLSNVSVAQGPGTVCGPTYPGVNETVDDVLIFATIDSIDGPGGILGSAGPCLKRSGTRWTVVGAMRFDSADVGLLEANGIFESVILHEMAHVLGFGTWWTVAPSLLVGAAASGGFDPYFIGPAARDLFALNGGAHYGNPTVPVEAGGGPGTRDSHWRESVMGAELMTGYISLNANPLSAITVASMGDMGYTVSYVYAESYVVSGVNLRAPGGGGALHLVEQVPGWPLQEIDPQGRITRVR